MFTWILQQPEVVRQLEQLPLSQQQALNAQLAELVQAAIAEHTPANETKRPLNQLLGCMEGQIHLGEGFDDPIPGLEY